MKKLVLPKVKLPKATSLKKISPKVLRRSLTAFALVLALGGTALIAYPFATNMWAARIQNGLKGDFAASVNTYGKVPFKVGDPLTRLEIPRLDVDVIVVEGTSLSALRAGAGHYPETPLPGQHGNVAIAGHRTTYGKPFNRMDELVEGDKVILTTPLGRYTYEITQRPWVVDDADWSPVDDYPAEGDYLTLTSCHPEGSAAYRIVARGKLIKSDEKLAQAPGGAS
jgi:sortase A